MTLIPGKLYTILDEKTFIFHQCRQAHTYFKTEFDANKPILFLSTTTNIRPTNVYPPYETFYNFLIESKIIPFSCFHFTKEFNETTKNFLSCITRIN